MVPKEAKLGHLFKGIRESGHLKGQWYQVSCVLNREDYKRANKKP
jgi:hypothetical protein